LLIRGKKIAALSWYKIGKTGRQQAGLGIIRNQ
jgi:hypothetical protein